MDTDAILERLDALAEGEQVADDDFEWLLAQREHADADVRAGACSLLGELLTAAEIVAHLESMLGDRDAEVREFAHEAMGEVVDEAVENGLLELDGRPDWIEERGWIAPEDARRVYARLQKTLADADEPLPVRLAALRALGFAGERDEVSTWIHDFLHHDEASARQTAIVAAAGTGDADRWSCAVTSALGDAAPEVRAAAALAAGRLLLADARPYLESTPQNEEAEPEERLMAAISALLLAPPDDRNALLERWRSRGVPDELLAEAELGLRDLEDWAEA